MTLYDCHIHLLNIDNVPDEFLGLRLDLKTSLMLWMSEKLSGIIPGDKDLLENVAEFQKHMGSDLETNYAGIKREYPEGSHVCVLCLDFSSLYGNMKAPYVTQVMDALALKRRHKNIEVFVHLDPNSPNMESIFDYCFASNRLADGVKLYPPLNSPVDHPKLIGIYRFCESFGIPITTHCSRTGMAAPTVWDIIFKKCLADPQYWIPIFQQFPRLKVNFAHFGGGVDAWEKTIIQLMKAYPNVYTDTSGSCGEDKRMKSYKEWVKKEPILIDRLLYGSDYFITDILDRSIDNCIERIKLAIGEEAFLKASEVNPVKFLKTL